MIADVNKFVKKLKDTTVIEREKLVLDVEVADITAAAEFFLNGEPIKPSERVEIKNLGGGKHQLIFSSVDVGDQGEIKCKSGRLKSTCKLTVNKAEGAPDILLEGPVEGPTGKVLIMDVPYSGKQLEQRYQELLIRALSCFQKSMESNSPRSRVNY